ncbi:hypothetical protein AWZ03_014256 [Drosophila navojoa]|uniref:Uncharacterized protein n=1 Tax=Drosophila navojoa TaxID=7232 RepID=A0A484ATD4_DRONA|nr:uncharacterized protein LOC108657899 [Drosophila navojoa]TDG39322.1 hypothetical protein AWZ03_014256 [Drosophila navojoa]
MGQLRMRRLQRRAEELVREFYESMLVLSLNLLLQWNQWHVIRVLKASKLPDEVPEPLPVSWATLFFANGLLLTLTQYRPQWLKRCPSVVRKLLLLLELFVMLFAVDYVLLTIWQPLLNICDQALQALGHSNWTWTRFIFYYCPGLSVWLINDAFYFMRFVASLSWFLLAIEGAAAKWRLAIDFMLLGQLPDTVILPGHRPKRHHTKSRPTQI